MSAATLSELELRELTRRQRPSAQAKILRALGVQFRTHPTDGVLLVAREAVRAALGVLPAAANDEPPTSYAVNVDAIRHHGAKAKAR